LEKKKEEKRGKKKREKSWKVKCGFSHYPVTLLYRGGGEKEKEETRNKKAPTLYKVSFSEGERKKEKEKGERDSQCVEHSPDYLDELDIGSLLWKRNGKRKPRQASAKFS